MSVQRKPEKAVTVLLEELKKVETHITDMHMRYEDISDQAGKRESKLNQIKERLIEMNKSMSRIKKWEKNMVEKFCDLERALDDAAHKSEADGVQIKMEEVDKDLGELESYISRENETVTLRDGDMVAEKQQNEVAPVSEEWAGESVSEEWASVGVEDEIMKSETRRRLWESIHFPERPHLRMCLLWLTVFPENRLIKKRPLIYCWMGEGVVSNEEKGKEVLKQLLEQGFLIKNNNKKQGGGSFTLCPLARRMLIKLAQKIGFSPLRLGGWDGGSHDQRAFLMTNTPNVEHLLTFINMDKQSLEGDKLDWLWKLNRLEVLQMGQWQDSASYAIETEDYEKLLEKALDRKKHLKYLSLRGISGIETLPAAAIRKLLSLRILDLRACHNLETLPRTIAELRNLTHLDVSECYMLESVPKGIRHLLNLQVLKGFVVGTPGRGSSEIADLSNLKQLRKLSIMVRSQGGRQLGSLEKLSESLSILTILWMGDADAAAVKLPTRLTRLDLLSVPFKELPEWLQPSKLTKLEKLRIRGGHLSNLPAVEYTSVNYLRLQCLEGLQHIEQGHLEAIFPNYLYLEKTSCLTDQVHPDIILPPQAP